MLRMTQKDLAPGVHLTAVETKKFKTMVIGITFLDSLRAETAAAHAMLPALLRRGTQQHPDMEAFSAALDELYGGAIEPWIRKKGETQCVGFVGSFLDDTYVPESLSVLEAATRLMGETLLSPAGDGRSFRSDYFESERQNLLRKIRAQKNEKRQYSMSRLTGLMCAGEAYGVDKLGDEAAAEALTEQKLWECYETLCREAPVELYYCGSAPVEQVEAAFRTALNRLPQTTRSPHPTCDATQLPKSPRFFEERMEVTQGKLALGFRLGTACTDEKMQATAMMLNAIYGGATTSKLFLHVRERLSLCYFASSVLEKHKGLLLVSSGVAFEKYEQAKNEILAQLEACRKGDISVDELEGARRALVSALQSTLDSQGRLEDYWLGQAVSGAQIPPERLAQAVEQVDLEAIVTLAQSVRLDSIYFLNGKE